MPCTTQPSRNQVPSEGCLAWLSSCIFSGSALPPSWQEEGVRFPPVPHMPGLPSHVFNRRLLDHLELGPYRTSRKKTGCALPPAPLSLSTFPKWEKETFPDVGALWPVSQWSSLYWMCLAYLAVRLGTVGDAGISGMSNLLRECTVLLQN